jgi:D-3-phosphoglycerate dehydrogenase
MPNILVTESQGFSPEAAALLAQLGPVMWGDMDRPALLAAVAQAEIVWIRLRHHIDAEVLAAAPRLHTIVTPTTGLNHIDLEAAARRGIRVLSLRDERTFLRDVRATAEHTLLLMLALLRRAHAAITHVHDGGWNRDFFRGHELHQKTVGVVGYGRLGRIVARYMHAFDTRVLAADPHVTPHDVAPEVTLVPLEELLPAADIVTLHVNLDPATVGFFGRAQFAAMRRGAWFINTSRGELVDEEALLESLQQDHIAGAALDVLSNEKATGMADHPLVVYARQHPNLIITPHIGGGTVESMAKTECVLARRLTELLTAVPVSTVLGAPRR